MSSPMWVVNDGMRQKLGMVTPRDGCTAQATPAAACKCVLRQHNAWYAVCVGGWVAWAGTSHNIILQRPGWPLLSWDQVPGSWWAVSCA